MISKGAMEGSEMSFPQDLMVCFTDGSKMSAEVDSGAGVYVEKGNIRGLKYLNTVGSKGGTGISKVVFCSDSQAAAHKEISSTKRTTGLEQLK